jgi:hypothetical protein
MPAAHPGLESVEKPHTLVKYLEGFCFGAQEKLALD